MTVQSKIVVTTRHLLRPRYYCQAIHYWIHTLVVFTLISQTCPFFAICPHGPPRFVLGPYSELVMQLSPLLPTPWHFPITAPVPVTQGERTRNLKVSTRQQTLNTQAHHRRPQAKAAEPDRPREETSRAMLPPHQRRIVEKSRGARRIQHLHETLTRQF